MSELENHKSGQTPTPTWEDRAKNTALQIVMQVENDSDWLKLSSHYNGFVRERAVTELGSLSSPEALICLIERLNDWVPQVRVAATLSLERHLSRADIQALLYALESFIALATRRRMDHGPTLAAVRNALQLPEVRSEVFANFIGRQGTAARYLYELLLENNTDAETLVRSALNHRELTVRLMAVSTCQALPQAQAKALLLEALSRPGGRVRVCILRALLPLLEDPCPLLNKALLDASPSIRALARWAADANRIDPIAVLNERLTQAVPIGKREWLGIFGLASELKIDPPPTWHAQGLHSAYASVRQAAVRLLRDDQIANALIALDDLSDKVFALAAEYLYRQPWVSIKAGLDCKLDRDGSKLPAMRLKALLHLRPKWQQLAYLLTRLENDSMAQDFWLEQVQSWCNSQYVLVDPVTRKPERDRLVEKLQKLAAEQRLDKASVARLAV